MSRQLLALTQATKSFNKASGHKKKLTKERATKRLYIRLTASERAELDRLSGSQTVSAYVREKALGEHVVKRITLRKPKMEDIQYSTLLAALGQSRLSSNVNQLAKHANMGTIDCTQNVEQQLEDASNAILAMRDALFMALGHRPNITGKNQ